MQTMVFGFGGGGSFGRINRLSDLSITTQLIITIWSWKHLLLVVDFFLPMNNWIKLSLNKGGGVSVRAF